MHCLAATVVNSHFEPQYIDFQNIAKIVSLPNLALVRDPNWVNIFKRNPLRLTMTFYYKMYMHIDTVDTY